METGPGCGNIQVDWKGMGRSSLIGDKLMKRKRSGRFKYKLKDMDMDTDCAKVMAVRKDGGKGTAVAVKAAHLYQTEVQNERGVGMGSGEAMEWQEEEKIQGGNSKGTNGIFDKKNWKLIQQKSALHTTIRKTKLKRKPKIRSDYAKVGKNGENVQNIMKFLEKMGESGNRSRSLTKKCGGGGMIGTVGLEDLAKCGNEDGHKYNKLRNTIDRGGVIQRNMWGRNDRAGVGRTEQLEK